MLQYIAIFEDAGPDSAIGVAFPDLPGCFSAGDTFEEAYVNAQDAIELWMDDPGVKAPPRPRRYSELKTDPSFNESLENYKGNHMIVVVPYRGNSAMLAAE